MRLYFFVFSFIFLSTLHSQTLQKYYDFNWKETELPYARFAGIIKSTDSGWHRSDYFLNERTILQMDGTYLDSSCKIPNGMFYYFHSNKKVQFFGKYSLGKKKGLWLSYHYNGVMSDSSFYEDGKVVGISKSWYPNGFGKDSVTVINGIQTIVTWYDDGIVSSAGRNNNEDKPIGKWQFFHHSGKLASLETYDNGILKNKVYYDENGSLIDTTNRDKAAEFPGGIKKWEEYLGKKLYFPTQYKIVNSDKAVVVVGFTISETGSVENAYVITPFYEDFNNIALDVIKKSSRWNPAIQHNRKVKFLFRQAVSFTQIEN